MKRTHLLVVVLACGLLATSLPASPSRAADSSSNWFTAMRRCSCSDATTSPPRSSRSTGPCPRASPCPTSPCREATTARTSPPSARRSRSLTSATRVNASTNWLGVSFDYNQIPHNMGNGHSLDTETSPGVEHERCAAPDAGRRRRADRDAQLPVLRRLLCAAIASADSIDVRGLRSAASSSTSPDLPMT